MEKVLSKNIMKFKDMTKIAEPVVDVNDVSRISGGTIIKGEISSPTDIRIDGKVEGKIYSKGKIVVGEKANVKGSLLCNVVDMWGAMDGDVYVKDTLSLKSTSSVAGSINARKLQVEMGAQINGTCHMISEAEYERLASGVVTTPVDAPKAAAQPVVKNAPAEV